MNQKSIFSLLFFVILTFSTLFCHAKTFRTERSINDNERVISLNYDENFVFNSDSLYMNEVIKQVNTIRKSIIEQGDTYTLVHLNITFHMQGYRFNQAYVMAQAAEQALRDEEVGITVTSNRYDSDKFFISIDLKGEGTFVRESYFAPQIFSTFIFDGDRKDYGFGFIPNVKQDYPQFKTALSSHFSH